MRSEKKAGRLAASAAKQVQGERKGLKRVNTLGMGRKGHHMGQNLQTIIGGRASLIVSFPKSFQTDTYTIQ